MKLSRRSIMVSAGAAGLCAIAPEATVARDSELTPLPRGGVNLAGADFGTIPGTHGREYLYPPRKHFDYFHRLGFSLIRLPFKWERLQPELNAPFAPGEQNLLVATVQHALANEQQLILDPHNFAKRRISGDGWVTEYLIGSPSVPESAFADFWSRLAMLFGKDERIVFGLMNEPVGITAEAWLRASNMAIAAIRATGAANLILVPGVEYSGAHSWHRTGNTALAAVVDPLNHFAFDVHQYFDRDSSGTKPEAVSGTIGSERIAEFQAWARQNGFKALLGEFNGGRNRTSYNALDDLCQELTANADVWLGWAAWAAGPRWPDGEMFNLEPWADGRTREQTEILAKYASPQSSDFWVATGATIDLDFARRRFHGAQFRSPDESRTPSTLQATGRLEALLQGNAWTLMIETLGLPEGAAVDLMTGNGSPFLRRSVDGAVDAVGLGTSERQPVANWRSKRRIALAVDRKARRIALGVTGARSIEIDGTLPAMTTLVIGSSTGSLCRVTGFPDCRSTEALEGLVA